MEENKEDNKKPHRDRHSGRLIITVQNPNLGFHQCLYILGSRLFLPFLSY